MGYPSTTAVEVRKKRGFMDEIAAGTRLRGRQDLGVPRGGRHGRQSGMGWRVCSRGAGSIAGMKSSTGMSGYVRPEGGLGIEAPGRMPFPAEPPWGPPPCRPCRRAWRSFPGRGSRPGLRGAGGGDGRGSQVHRREGPQGAAALGRIARGWEGLLEGEGALSCGNCSMCGSFSVPPILGVGPGETARVIYGDLTGRAPGFR